MTRPIPPPIVISELDAERIETLLETPLAGSLDTRALEAELDRAERVAPTAMPPDVVSMNSVARVRDETSGAVREIALVYPRDADGDPGRVSILAPIGTALLGLRVGSTIRWPLPGGRSTRLTVEAISYQPEAAGDLHR
ncbi:nucleoside diphosphate kinase regulator [Marilutibacter chinensis]|uniref:Nucleoside diphosphate kinase regulator n=1 Tax=Marilutibacter chinensis TaxID=2912247 RepID=A0ABS9HUU4_9GAMM|nr:nucleoside diphosphate kinase regulator [Lysobacter chinensis]MCF7222640.1 nucleoside diphosphate kinase regulator [Lysobacter chinensis]